MSLTSISIGDRITRRHMRRAAQDCLISIRTGRTLDAIAQRARFLGYANALRERGFPVGTMIEEAISVQAAKKIAEET